MGFWEEGREGRYLILTLLGVLQVQIPFPKWISHPGSRCGLTSAVMHWEEKEAGGIRTNAVMHLEEKEAGIRTIVVQKGVKYTLSSSYVCSNNVFAWNPQFALYWNSSPALHSFNSTDLMWEGAAGSQRER